MKRNLELLLYCVAICALAVGAYAAEAGAPQKAAEQPAVQPAAATAVTAAESKPAPASEAAAKSEEKAAEETKAEEKAGEEKPAAPTKPSTTKVEKGPFKIEVELKATFEAQSSREIVLQPDAWSTLKVVKAVDHGTKVKKGDMLVELDTQDIDKAIADLESDLELSDLSIQDAEAGLKAIEATTPMEVAAADRANRYAQEDKKRYFDVEVPLSKKLAEYSLKSSYEMLEYQQEELRQLEKMYKADELVEETEELILKRARRSVERAKFYVEQAEIRHDEAMKIELPRRNTSMEESARLIALATEKAKAVAPISLDKAKIELSKLQVQKKRSQEKLAELKADREMMTVKAPTSGIVYYGRCEQGKWTGASTAAGKLKPGGTLSPNEVFMTVVQPRPLVLRAEVPEKELHQVTKNVRGTAAPAGWPEVELPAVVQEVGTIPTIGGDFDARIWVNLGKEAEAVMPGMTAKVTLVPYQQRDAISVPKTAVGEEAEGKKHFVMVVGKDGKKQKRAVTVGKRSDDKIEIVKGLSVGDEILTTYPEKK